MMRQSITGLVLTIGIIALGIADLVVALWMPDVSTVSDVMAKVGFKTPMVVFAVGFICGHLFGYMRLETICAKCKVKGVADEP